MEALLIVIVPANVFRVSSLDLRLGLGHSRGTANNIPHLLLIHRKVLVINVLRPRLVIVRLYHFLNPTRKRPLARPFLLLFYDLLLRSVLDVVLWRLGFELVCVLVFG